RRVLSGDENVALTEDVERAACRHAVDGRDDGLPTVLALGSQPVARVVERVRVVLLVDRNLPAVHTGREGPVTRRGEDDGADALVVPDLGPGAREFTLHHGVVGVVYFGPVERHERDAVLFSVQQRLELHSPT